LTIAMRLRSPLLLTLLALCVLSAAVANGRPAHAQEPMAGEPAVFFGFVFPDERGLLPEKIRAAGPGAQNCGTAHVERSGGGLGFYLLHVASATEHAGCPAPGGEVRFLLLFDKLDPGVPAVPPTARWAAGAQMISMMPLTEAGPGTGTYGFVGEVPGGPGLALLAWRGPDATPVEHAIRTISADVAGVYRWDRETRTWLVYLPGAPTGISTYHFVAANDIVVVRAR
jgi:hypothetical protein